MTSKRDRAPHVKARPIGTGHQREDEPLARRILQLVADGTAKSRTEAARTIASLARGNSEAAKIDRLVRLAGRLNPPVIPAGDGGASLTPSTPMSTTPHTAHAANRLNRLKAENAALKAERDHLREQLAEAQRRLYAAIDVLETRLPRAERRQDEIEAARRRGMH